MYDIELRYFRVAVLATLAALAFQAVFAAEYTLDLRSASAESAQPPVLRRASMSASVGTVPAVAVGDVLTLRLFDDVTVSANVAAALPGAFSGGKSFSLTLEDGVFGSTLVVNPDGLFIELRDIGADRLYTVSARDGKAYIEETDLSLVRRGDCIEVETPELDADGEDSGVVTTSKRNLLRAVPGNPFDDNAVAPAPVMVDIMIVFDNGARAWVDSSSKYSSITNFAIAQVAKMNSVLRNTDLHTNFWYRLVDVATVDGRWTKIDDTILPAMRTGVMDASGIWSEVAARREACGADVVSLIVDTGSAYGTTGIGYITHGTSYNTWVSTYRTWCYSCCAIRSVENDYTLSHEVGHNMGLTHSPTLATWSKIGTFDYSNGYNITNANDGKHYNTIMAYNFDRYYSDYIEIPYFSSPLHTYAGVPVGTAISNDCTRALRQTCVGIADWHSQTIPLPSDIVFSPTTSSAYRISLSNLGGYEIRYTTDGSTPTRDSTLYEGPIKLTSGEMTVKAVAVVDGETLGAVAAKTYGAAVELGEYVWLEDTMESEWSQGYWDRNDGTPVYSYFWNSSSDKTAVIDVDGLINVDRDISLGTLVVGGATNIEISVGDNRLFATNLEVVAQATLSGANYTFNKWWLHPESTLTLSPGEGQVMTLDKYLSIGAVGSTLAITNGTLKITKSANPGDGTATLQNSSVRVDDGGILLLEPGWVLGYANTNPVTVNKGGLIKINKLESTARPLILNGGNVEINLTGRACELRSMSLSATDDSSISDTTSSGEAEVYIYGGDAAINVSEGKTLTVDARITTRDDNNTHGHGIKKTGNGEARFLREVTHTGTNTVDAGTFTIAYNSTAPGCLHWSVASGAALKIEEGASLLVPSLALPSGATLVLPAAATAPLVVTGSVDVTGVRFSLYGTLSPTEGASYPLVESQTGLTGVGSAVLDDMPSLAENLYWRTRAEDGVLYAEAAAKGTLEIRLGETVLLSDISAGVTNIIGEGTLICDATLPAKDYGLTGETWKGTVVFRNFNNENAAKDFQVEKYGNAKSKVQFTNCKIPYLKDNNATFAGTVVLDGDSALTVKDGYSNNYSVFGALEGNGTMTFLDKPMQWYVFNTATNFTGSISVQHGFYDGTPQGRRVVFGTTASTDDLPAQSASITVKPGAEAAIGANATWYAYHGVEIAGTLLVKGAGATLNCDANAAMGLKLDDGATLRFETADAMLAFAQAPQFADGAVNVAFAGGVALSKGKVLVTWPENAVPAGDFAFADSALAARWALSKTATGLVVANAPLPEKVRASIAVRYFGDDGWEDRKLAFDLPTAWITNYYPMLETVEAVAAKYDETAANGAKVWQCYMLGLDPTNAASAVSLSMNVVSNKIHFAVEGLGETHALDGIEVQWRMKTSTNLVADAAFSNTREYKKGLPPEFGTHSIPDTPKDPDEDPFTKPADTLFYKITVSFVAEDEEEVEGY